MKQDDFFMVVGRPEGAMMFRLELPLLQHTHNTITMLHSTQMYRVLNTEYVLVKKSKKVKRQESKKVRRQKGKKAKR